MNAAKLYDQQQQQQQQHGYRTLPASQKPTAQPNTYSSANSSTIALGRPLPKTPGSQQLQLDPSMSANSTIGSSFLGRKSQQYLGLSQQQQQQQQPILTQEEESSYYAALTRPISPTVVMSYVPPPISSGANSNSTTQTAIESPGVFIPPPVSQNISSTATLRPHSATAALSSSFNTLGPGSQPTPKPNIQQGARSSYIHPVSSMSSPGTTRAQQGGNMASLDAEDPASSSSRFARRGPLTINNETGGSGDNVRSRRGSGAYSDTFETPSMTQYRQQFHTQQQAFSPSSQRNEGSGAISPIGSGIQLQVAKEGWLWRRGNLLTWKRCYAIGRYRGDSNPGILTLFKDNEHLFPIKTIDMAECLEVQVKGQDAKATGRFEFKVVTRREETWFASDTMSERTGWIDALNSLMAKAVGASLLKLEAKLNNIRQRNNSFDYASSSAGSSTPERPGTLEEQLQLVQQDLVTREQQLSQREQELERKRVETLLVQLEAWRAAAKVTVNQHYTVRDQLLERVMKTARTTQELIERARIHLETGSDQITEVVNSHLECLKVHAGESPLNSTSYKMLKSILVGLSVNLDTRSSEMKRVILALDQYISASKTSASTSTPASPTSSLSPTNYKDRRMSVGASFHYNVPPPSFSSSMSISVYIIQVREKYKETLDILEDHSKRLKRTLERTDISNSDSTRRFHEEVKENLKGLLKLPSYVFAPCLPDQPLPGAVDTFYRDDLVQIQRKSKEFLKKAQGIDDELTFQQSPSQPITVDIRNEEPIAEEIPKQTSVLKASALPNTESSQKQVPTISASSSSSPTPPKLSLALPATLSSFLLPDSNSTAASTVDLTQKLRDTILPEFDHLSIKQEESLQSMTTLLNQVSSVLVNKLAEIKEATAGQRQEFEELKDEIIDVMQLSATDPSSHQRDISALSEIRSKLAEITEQLTKVQNSSQIMQNYYGSTVGSDFNGNRRLVGPGGGSSPSGNSAAIKTGISLLQRSASTMVSSSVGGTHPFYHTIDSGSRQHLQRVNSTSLQNRLQIPSSASLASGYLGPGLASITNPGVSNGSKHSKIAGMARLFEDKSGDNGQPFSQPSFPSDIEYEQDRYSVHNQIVVTKLDQLLLLLEFVNTAQCRMMAYQDLEFDRSLNQGSSIDDARMMAVQEHMEHMDQKMNLQMQLLRNLVSPQGENAAGAGGILDAQIHEVKEEESDSAYVEGDGDSQSPPISLNLQNRKSLKISPSDDSLTFVDVLNRLDLQVIPTVQGQSSRIQELSDQLSEMKRQLDEQQQRQNQQFNASIKSRDSILTNLGRSNSFDRPLTPAQQQQIGSSVTSPLDAETPASWRAALRPSPSVGGSSSILRDRATAAAATVAANTTIHSSGSTSSVSSLSSQSNFPDSQLLTRTSERVADILDKMDTKMGQVIDEQLSRYESVNKDLLAKVYELLESDVLDSENRVETETRLKSREKASQFSGETEGSPTVVVSKPDLAPLTLKLQGIETALAVQVDQSEQRQVGNKALWKEIATSLEELHGHNIISAQSQQQWINDVKDSLDKVLKGQTEIFSKGTLRGDSDTTLDSDGLSSSKIDLSDSFEMLKSLIQQEADRSEFSLNEQRDEILEKMNQIVSSIQDSQADVTSKDASIKEELQDMRDWIVKHSSMQTENLREIVFAATSNQGNEGAKSLDKENSSRSIDSEIDGVDIGGNGSEEEYTQVDILDDLDQDSISRNNISRRRPPSNVQNQTSETAKELKDLKEQFEMFTKIQMATFSEMSDNVSGVEKMMRDMSKMMGVRRGGTVMRKKEAEQDRAMIAAEVKGTIEEVMTRMNSSPSIPTLSSFQKGSSPRSSMDNIDDKASPISPTSATPSSSLPRGESGLLKYLYQPRRLSLIVTTGSGVQQPSASATAKAPSSPADKAPPSISVFTSFPQSDSMAGMLSPRSPDSPTVEYMNGESQNQNVGAQLSLIHDQMEQLYRRKARVEIEVEDLESEKSKLSKENEELRNQVEQLRKEKQEMLLSRRSGSSEETIVEQPISTASVLEKALSDRVAMLLQETARLEALKKQLES